MFLLPLSAVKRCFLWGLGERGQDAVITVTQLEVSQVNKSEVPITDSGTQVRQVKSSARKSVLFIGYKNT